MVILTEGFRGRLAWDCILALSLPGCVLCACSVASVMSNTLQPHGLQPTRLLCPWDFPGKSTGVGCHRLLCYLPIVFSKQRNRDHVNCVTFYQQAEGIEKSYSQSILLDLTDRTLQTTLKTLSFSFPPHTVGGSERVQITAIGKNRVYHPHCWFICIW